MGCQIDIPVIQNPDTHILVYRGFELYNIEFTNIGHKWISRQTLPSSYDKKNVKSHGKLVSKNSLPLWRSAELGIDDTMCPKLVPIETGYIVSSPRHHVTTKKRMTTASLVTNRSKLHTAANADVRIEKFSSDLTTLQLPIST